MAPTTQIQVLWIAVIVLAVLTLFSLLRTPRIPNEISVQRLNVVEPDGALAWVLANSERPPPATIDGQVITQDRQEDRRGLPSMIFFDGRGDEVGGMTMGVRETSDGYRATRHLSLDAYKQDQTVQLAHYQDPTGSTSGVIISDRSQDLSLLEVQAELGLEPGTTREQLQAAIQALPEEGRNARLRQLFGGTRAFFGASTEWTGEREALLVLNDSEGRPRILLAVPDSGEPSIQILDEEGEVVLRLPE